MDDTDLILRAVFAKKSSRGFPPHSLFEAWRRGWIPKPFMKEALEILRRLESEYPRKPTRAIPARGLPYNDPGWDNVVRALEEDR